MLIPLIGHFFTNVMMDFFVGMLDSMAYNLLSVAYNVFVAVARIDIFGGSAAGKVLYDNITQRIYTILSIAMIFVFAYQLIMLIVDPEGKERSASSKLVRDTVFSLILIVLLPTIFRYISLFQSHVLSEGTIPAIILGTRSGNGKDPGKSIAAMVFLSFYHPRGTMWNTYFKNDGTVDRENAISNCKNETKEINGEEYADTCEKYVNALMQWESAPAIISGMNYITEDSQLRHRYSKDEGAEMEYLPLLTTATGLLVAWLFFSYAIDIGTRAVKLGVLELIAPVPVILRIFPKSKKIFETWFLEIERAYLEIFIRLIVIFFGIEIVKMVPLFNEIIFKRTDDGTINDGALTKCVAMVILILGILKFCQIAPELFKEIFSAGNNLLKGLNFKPGMKSRVEDNKLAMKGLSVGTGALSGGVHRAVKGAIDGYKNTEGHGGWVRRTMAGLANGALSLPRGLIAGGKAGLENDITKLSKKQFKNTAQSGIEGASDSYKNRHFKKTRDNLATMVHDMASPKLIDIPRWVDAFTAALSQQKVIIGANAKEMGGELKHNSKQFWETLTGYESPEKEKEGLGKLKQYFDAINSVADTSELDKKLEELKNEKRKADIKAITDPKYQDRQEAEKKSKRLEAAIEKTKEDIRTKQVAAANANPEFTRQAAQALTQLLEQSGPKMQQQLTDAITDGMKDLLKSPEGKVLSANDILKQLASGKEMGTAEKQALDIMMKSVKNMERIASSGVQLNEIGNPPTSDKK